MKNSFAWQTVITILPLTVFFVMVYCLTNNKLDTDHNNTYAVAILLTFFTAAFATTATAAISIAIPDKIELIIIGLVSGLSVVAAYVTAVNITRPLDEVYYPIIILGLFLLMVIIAIKSISKKMSFKYLVPFLVCFLPMFFFILK